MAITVPPELMEKINQTQADQAEADKIGLQAAGAVRPGAVREAWVTVPDIKEGPFTIRRFKDGDFKRLDEMGHPLNNQKAMYEWAQNPVASGPDCWLLLWMLTRPVAVVKEKMITGKDKVLAEAEEIFSDLDGIQLAVLSGKVGIQMATYLGAQLSYESLPQEGQPSPPPLSQPPLTDSAG